MKSWIKKTLITVFGLSLLTGGLSACSRHHSDWSEADTSELRGKLVSKVTSKLDLTQPQQEKLTLLADQLIALRSQVKGDSSDPRTELASLISSDSFDRNRAQALFDSKTQALQNQGPQVISALADFYDSLNPEQQLTLREKLERRKSWFHNY